MMKPCQLFIKRKRERIRKQGALCPKSRQAKQAQKRPDTRRVMETTKYLNLH
jgi:hypothetical protein